MCSIEERERSFGIKKIVILGAGVGGLSCAHQLSKSKNNYDITIVERNSEVGGQARSKRLSNGLHSEYCWHVIGQNYYNLWQIMKEIPYENKSVADNLKPIRQYIYGRYKEAISSTATGVWEELGNSFLVSGSYFRYILALYHMGTLKKISMYDVLKMIEIWYITNTNSLQTLEKYDSILWKEFTRGMSLEARKWISDSPAIYLGMDIDKLSAHTMLHLLRPIYQGNRPYDFYSFNGPFNEKWFEPWKKYLIDKGVKFVSGNIINVAIKDNVIDSIATDNEIIKGDVFMNALSVESLAALIPLERFTLLAERGRQIQTQVLYYIDSRLKLKQPCIMILPDTPWCIMIRSEGELWNNPTVKEDSLKTNIDYEDILSTGIGIWSRPGLKHKKPALECTLNEIKEECWEQVRHSDAFMKAVKLHNGQSLKDVGIVYADIWHSFQQDSLGKITTWEPKFSNNVGTLQLRPNVVDGKIINLLHSTAYTLTNANIFNMESACEAGCRAAYVLDSTLSFNNKRDNPGWIMGTIQNM